jgi:hypothetical protein
VLIPREIKSCLPVSLHSAWTSTTFMIKWLCSFEAMEIDYQVIRFHSKLLKNYTFHKNHNLSNKEGTVKHTKCGLIWSPTPPPKKKKRLWIYQPKRKWWLESPLTCWQNLFHKTGRYLCMPAQQSWKMPRKLKLRKLHTKMPFQTMYFLGLGGWQPYPIRCIATAPVDIDLYMYIYVSIQ